MPNWADPIVAGDDLQDKALLNMLVAAINERGIAVNSNNSFPVTNWPSFLTSFSTGDNIQQAFVVWSQNGGATQALQSAVLAVLGAFADYTLAYQGYSGASLFITIFPATTPVAKLTFSRARQLAGLPTTYSYSGDSTHASTEDVSQRNSLFRRLRPREIDSISATFDVNGNAATAGQFARLINDVAGSGSLGKLYKCVSSGNWIRTASDSLQADILDNTMLPPNCVNSNVTATVGDYVGAHLYEEVRAVTNQMVWTFTGTGSGALSHAFSDITVPFTQFTVAGQSKTAAIFGAVSEAAGRASLIAAWATATPAANFTVVPGSKAITQKPFPTSWNLSATRADLTYTYAFNPACSVFAREVTWFNYGEFPLQVSTDTAYDANGDPINFQTWNQFFDVGPTTALSISSNLLGQIGAIPDAPTTPSVFQSIKGAEASYVGALVKWNVPGGFVYVTFTTGDSNPDVTDGLMKMGGFLNPGANMNGGVPNIFGNLLMGGAP